MLGSKYLVVYAVTLGTLGQVIGAALKEDLSFVITGSKNADAGDIRSRSKRDASGSSIKSLRVTSVIVSRFARVTFVSKMENNDDSPKEMVFSVRLPTAAFITEFNMVVGGVTFIGKVKEKEAAKEQFDRAVESGNTAGLVVADVRETQTFDVSANVPAHSSVDFHLVYQQLLQRKLGEYEHAIMVNTRQIIDDFVIDVYITETSGITSLATEFPGESEGGVRGKGERGRGAEIVRITTDVRRSRTQAKVSFTPSATEKRRLLNLPEDEQRFTVKYDVTRESLGGEIQMRNGYFVHFFAPEDLPIMPKRVVFVIDRSGSMSGRKMEQTKSAFVSVIKELRDSDKFNIISFAGDVTSWKKEETGLIDVTTKTVNEAISYVKSIVATGSTNLNGAVLEATKLLSNYDMEDRASAMIILLTDGMPTEGVTNLAQIRLNAKEAISGKFSLFCLGFGENLNHDFLKRLATENDGIARQIYEASDADLQLKGFFQEVATPLLLNVKMTYEGANLTDVSDTDFGKFFSGSEAVIVGSYEPGPSEIRSTIRGESGKGEEVYSIVGSEVDDTFQHWFKDTGEFDDFIERLWAYFTITNLLEKKTLSEDRLEIQGLESRVIYLALKYKFVTPLTSLVVTLPEDEITTTTVGPDILTPIPPLPPCYARGAVVPRRVLHPIWCPIILDPLLSSSARDQVGSPNQPQPQRAAARGGRGRSIARGTSRGSARALAFRPAATPPPRRVASFSGGFSSRSLAIDPLSFFGASQPGQPGPAFGFGGRGPIVPQATGLPRPWFPMTTIRVTPLTTPPPPRIWKKCSGRLKDTSGTLTLPTSAGPNNVFLCKKQIILERKKWIDLHIETANTTKNEVIITGKKGKTLFRHLGGISTPRSIYLDHSKVEVLFTVYEEDTIRPGIVISYQEFSPDLEEVETKSYDDEIDVSMMNCGNNISSSESLTGFIESPNYPKMYPENAYCIWSLADGSSGYRLRLSFVDVDIESSIDGSCDHDKLVVMQGDNDEHTICGYKKPKDMIFDDGTAEIAFMSDDALGAGGFKIRYDFVPN